MVMDRDGTFFGSVKEVFTRNRDVHHISKLYSFF